MRLLTASQLSSNDSGKSEMCLMDTSFNGCWLRVLKNAEQNSLGSFCHDNPCRPVSSERVTFLSCENIGMIGKMSSIFEGLTNLKSPFT